MLGGRRRLFGLGLGLGAALLLAPSFAWAGSYLTRAALLVSEGSREATYLRNRFGDKELAMLVHRMAQARLQAGSAMLVPKEVAQAHPHLLLVLENYERATDAAVRGESERFLVYYQRAQDEERTFRAVLKQLGWELPSS